MHASLQQERDRFQYTMVCLCSVSVEGLQFAPAYANCIIVAWRGVAAVCTCMLRLYTGVTLILDLIPCILVQYGMSNLEAIALDKIMRLDSGFIVLISIGKFYENFIMIDKRV